MFLVDDDKPQIRKRCEKSGSRTDHNIDLPICRPLRLLIALSRRKSGIHNTNPVSKSPVKTHHGLVRQGDLRDQDDGLPAFPEDVVDEFHVDLRLAASRDSVEQIGITLSGIIVPDHGLCRVLLFLIQGDRSGLWKSVSCSRFFFDCFQVHDLFFY